MWRHVFWLSGILVGAVVVGAGIAALYAYAKGSGPPPSRYAPKGPITQFSNDDWASVLRRVVADDGYSVRYDLLSGNIDGTRDALYRYVALVAEVSPENRPELFATEDDKLAYYINAYNALAMYGVMKRDLPRNVLRSGLFWINYFPVGGQRMNLGTLEKSRIRSRGDPRIHFALNCMSFSCPPLRREPYDGTRLNQQLDEQGRIFLSSDRAVRRVDADTVALSELFTSFYRDDFIQAHQAKTAQKDAGLLEALRRFAAPDSPLHGAADYVTMPYNWSLNTIL